MARPKNPVKLTQQTQNVRVRSGLLLALQSLLMQAPDYFGTVDPRRGLEMALVEFLQRWVHVFEIPSHLLRGHPCPACKRMTYLIPLAHPGLLTYVDAGHEGDCKQYRATLEQARNYWARTRDVETDLLEFRTNTPIPGLAITMAALPPREDIHPVDYAEAYYRQRMFVRGELYEHATKFGAFGNARRPADRKARQKSAGKLYDRLGKLAVIEKELAADPELAETLRARLGKAKPKKAGRRTARPASQ